MKNIIAITGGIGSGKSVVSRVLTIMGYKVYDSDIEAKKLMRDSIEIKDLIRASFPPHIIHDGLIDKEELSKIVFADKEMLKKLNDIVHPVVRNHFKEWVLSCYAEIVFIETAILYESKLNLIVDEIWSVYAPEDIRINRVMKRNFVDANSVKMRINSQQNVGFEDDNKIKKILNDDKTALLPQIIRLIENVK